MHQPRPPSNPPPAQHTSVSAHTAGEGPRSARTPITPAPPRERPTSHPADAQLPAVEAKTARTPHAAARGSMTAATPAVPVGGAFAVAAARGNDAQLAEDLELVHRVQDELPGCAAVQALFRTHRNDPSAGPTCSELIAEVDRKVAEWAKARPAERTETQRQRLDAARVTELEERLHQIEGDLMRYGSSGAAEGLEEARAEAADRDERFAEARSRLEKRHKEELDEVRGIAAEYNDIERQRLAANFNLDLAAQRQKLLIDETMARPDIGREETRARLVLAGYHAAAKERVRFERNEISERSVVEGHAASAAEELQAHASLLRRRCEAQATLRGLQSSLLVDIADAELRCRADILRAYRSSFAALSRSLEGSVALIHRRAQMISARFVDIVADAGKARTDCVSDEARARCGIFEAMIAERRAAAHAADPPPDSDTDTPVVDAALPPPSPKK